MDDTINASGVAFLQDESVPTHAEATSEVFAQTALIALRTAPPPWLSDCLRKIDELQQLGPNWDSYGAQPVTPISIRLTQEVLKELAMVETVEPPTVTASPDGNAALCWDNKGRSLDIEIYPDGKIGYAYLNELEPPQEQSGITRNINKLAVLLTQW